MAPSITEILFALDLGHKVVGVTNYCDYPPEAAERAPVGGFKGKSIETILSLSPDLVIGTEDGNEAPIFRTLDRLNIRTLKVQPSTIEGVIETVQVVGRAAGRPEKAEELARRLERRLGAIKERVAGARRVGVLFVYGREPLVLAGPGTFADDMIVLAGGENVAADALIPYPRFSMETVMAKRPGVIIEGGMGSEAVERETREAANFWSRYPSLPAVRDGRVVVLDEDLIARPGPRIFDGIEDLARVLHPERFGGDGL